MPRDVVPIRALAAPRLGQQVQVAVIGQDQVRLVADDQPVPDFDAVPAELIDLGEERLRVHDDAVAYHARHALVQDAGRDQAQDELPAVHEDGMAGVVATLIPRHDVEMRGHEIDDLAFAFVAPLRAEHS